MRKDVKCELTAEVFVRSKLERARRGSGDIKIFCSSRERARVRLTAVFPTTSPIIYRGLTNSHLSEARENYEEQLRKIRTFHG